LRGRRKARIRKKNCSLDKKPTDNDNNLNCGSANENNSEGNRQPGKGENNPKRQSTQGYNQSESNLPKNDSTGLIVGGVAVVSFIFLATVLVLKGKKSKK
jgi:hypothetical protein